ncbi:hypothetical protein D3C80_1304960 [compost metagenome]
MVRGAAFGKDRQGIGMALVEFGQGHVTASDACQALPPPQGVALARQGQQVKVVSLQRLDQRWQLGIEVERLRPFGKGAQQAVKVVQIKVLNDAHQPSPSYLRLRAVID